MYQKCCRMYKEILTDLGVKRAYNSNLCIYRWQTDRPVYSYKQLNWNHKLCINECYNWKEHEHPKRNVENSVYPPKNR